MNDIAVEFSVLFGFHSFPHASSLFLGSQKIPKYVTTPKQPSARLLQSMGNGRSRTTRSALSSPFTTSPEVHTVIFATQIPGTIRHMSWILMFRKQQASLNTLPQNIAGLGLIQKAWTLIDWALKQKTSRNKVPI